MKKFRKLAIAGLAVALGVASTMALARPDCDSMEALCQAGYTNWCSIWETDPSCH
ncbi:hypothetical protein [Shewanella salipaludis]|uniref:Uncharacterized protein n=1 Tax=Shewanella salipaludis TaxID=2723052 RepID=A0A972JNT2_9GAMM|nr:hypothetical protein [Shewanella salipaludis]NMH66471.1 hypothetical protein [Shewanella salipaludis]